MMINSEIDDESNLEPEAQPAAAAASAVAAVAAAGTPPPAAAAVFLGSNPAGARYDLPKKLPRRLDLAEAEAESAAAVDARVQNL